MYAVEPETDALGGRRACLSMGTGGISAQTLGTILTGLVHCLEPHGFHLGILVRDGAEEVVAAAVLADLLGCRSMMILSTSISVSARRSTADRSSHQPLPTRFWIVVDHILVDHDWPFTVGAV
jgi:hypothetical protein